MVFDMTLPLALPRDSSSWKLGGTETFRASASKILDQFGGNRQNVAKGLRKYYLADPGKKLIQRDQEGAEAKVVAYLARKGKYRKLFENGIKPHSYMAMVVFRHQWEDILGKSIEDLIVSPIEDLKNRPLFKELFALIKDSDDWPGSKRYYFIGKKIVHASSYGMKGPTFAISVLTESEGQIRLSVREANHYLDAFHATFPEIRYWHMETESVFRQNKCLRNLFGFPWYKRGAISDDLLRKLYAFVPQSTVGCITHIALTATQAYIEEHHKDWDILNNCHDSFLIQFPEGEEKEIFDVTKNLMNQQLVTPRGETFMMTSSASIGDNWGPYDDKKNPTGLKEVKL